MHPISPLTLREDRGKAKGPKRDDMDSPRMTTIRNLAEALEVDPAELFEYQTLHVVAFWLDAGAHRYILRY